MPACKRTMWLPTEGLKNCTEMIEALLLTVFVAAVVILAFNISRKSAHGQQPSLGIFSYKPDVGLQSIDERTKR